MAIRPESDSKLWDDYPVDDSPLPERPVADHADRAVNPMVLAGAMVAMLLVAGLLAMTFSGGDEGPDPTPNTLSFESDS